MKQKQDKIRFQSGFTVVELLVVLSIMVVIATVVIIDFNRQRAVRNVILAKNETVTNLRKVQSYMLSSKNIAEDVPAKFYIAEFEMAGGGALTTSYKIHAVDNEYNLHEDLETVALPSGVAYSAFMVAPASKGQPVSYNCLQIIFSAPFGKMYVNGSSSCDSSIEQIVSDPITLASLIQRRAYLFLSVNGEDKGSITINPVTGQIATQ